MAEGIALAITGASGSPYALRLLEILLRGDEPVYLMISTPGRMVLASESNLQLPSRTADIHSILIDHLGADPAKLEVFGREDWFAPVASGSNPPRAMVVCPCTTGTLGAIASGASRTLIERAADVVLKEQRKLVLAVRETPLSVLHLENMLRLARAGAVILPANPGFYFTPKNIADLVDFVVGRILDQLDIGHDLTPRWGMDRVDGDQT